MSKKLYKQYAVICSAMVIAFLIIENLLYSPQHLWFIYAIYPIVWYHSYVFRGKSEIIEYCTDWLCKHHLLLFIHQFHHVPTISLGDLPGIFSDMVVLALYHAQKRTFVAFSVYASLHISIFFIIVNIVSSPSVIWAIYPIFLVLWWPLSMYFYVYKRRLYQSSTMTKDF